MNFRIGNIGEQLLIELLKKFQIKAERTCNQKYKYDHDISFNYRKKEYTVEVKYDLMAQKTGNIAIETWNSKKDRPSGLSATKADFWCHIIPSQGFDYIFLTSVKLLKAFVGGNEAKKIVERAGDANATLHIYDEKKILDSIFKRIDCIYDKETFDKNIKELLH